MTQLKHKRKNLLFILGSIFFFILCLLSYSLVGPLLTKTTLPDYLDISPLINKLDSNQNLTEEEYHTLNTQTGLSNESIEILLKEDSKYLLDFQKDNIYNTKKKTSIFYFCSMREQLVSPHLPFINLRDGDILISNSSSTLGYRHGHAALVVDASKGVILESYHLFKNSGFSYVGEFLNYPSVMLLRLKDEYLDIVPLIVEYAVTYLNDIKYGLLSSTNCNISNIEPPKKTHCSHLVWLAYKTFGLDLNSDGGRIVTPNDISRSNLLRVVEVKGFDFDKLW